MNDRKTGALIAIAAGSLFAAACSKDEPKQQQQPAAVEKTKPEAPAATTDQPAATGEKTAKMYCKGVNACKGQGACKTAANGCAGQNACTGQGLMAMTEEECEKKGGTMMPGMQM